MKRLLVLTTLLTLAMSAFSSEKLKVPKIPDDRFATFAIRLQMRSGPITDDGRKYEDLFDVKDSSAPLLSYKQIQALKESVEQVRQCDMYDGHYEYKCIEGITEINLKLLKAFLGEENLIVTVNGYEVESYLVLFNFTSGIWREGKDLYVDSKELDFAVEKVSEFLDGFYKHK